MSDVKHTPGPWRVIHHMNGTWDVLDQNDNIVARSLGGMLSVKTQIEYEANGNTIAAAPELLEALLAAKYFGSQGETHEGVSVSYLIDNAIAKAKGESQ